MELKHADVIDVTIKFNRFNRTFMELKRPLRILSLFSASSFNRTFMELKHP